MQTSIKPKRDDTLLSNWESMPERAPSLETPDKPIVARIMAMIGLFLFVLGALAVTYPLWRTGQALIGFGWGFFFGSIGLCMILFHVYSERDFQFRRLYAFVGIGLVLAAIVLRLLAIKQSQMHWYAIGGIPAFVIGLIVIVGVLRQETDAGFRKLLLNIVGVVGALMIVFSVAMGVRFNDFLAGEGAVMMLLGLLYASAYIGLNDNPMHSYYAGLFLGGWGVLGLVAGLVKSFLPESNFLVPSGLVLITMSLVYVAVAIGVCLDWPVVVLTRRELGTFFYSPLAYLVLIGQLILTGFMFNNFIESIAEGGQGVPEPIVGIYFFSIIPVIVQLFIVPALTMRLLSEENRSGTLEVMLTAPVTELSIVLGKFFATWALYMLMWAPSGLFLIALRYVGGEDFDFRPLFSFYFAMATISAGLIAMGLFMSSLTRNQLIAAVLTFVGVMVHLAFYFAKFQRSLSAYAEILGFVNYLDFMYDSLQGTIAPRYFIYHLSVAAFFLFATVKVLESRKWK